MAAQLLVRQAGEGERLAFAGGGLITVKASTAETDGGFLLFEDRVTRGKTTPLHVHPHDDEAIYVLAGERVVHVAGEERRIGAGGFLLAPRGVPHALLVVSPSAHLLALMTPGSGEAFFRAASDPAQSHADAERPADIPRLVGVAETDPSIDVLGPPPFEAIAPSTAAT